jgi:hypothetical protein
MRFEEYQSNEAGLGGPLVFEEGPRSTFYNVIKKYDDGKLCEVCHYFDENGEEMKKEDFLKKYLPTNERGDLIETECDAFEYTIDQSNKPQTLLVRALPSKTHKTKRLIAGIGKRFRSIFSWKNAA